MASHYATIDEYIASFPSEVQTLLQELRRAIRRAAPQTEEAISYQIPVFRSNGRYLVYFGAWKHHIGLYPVPELDEGLERELAPYRAAKATLRFPLRKPIPYELVGRVVASLIRQRVDQEG